MAKDFIHLFQVVGLLLRNISSASWLAFEHEVQPDNTGIGSISVLASTFKVLWCDVYNSRKHLWEWKTTWVREGPFYYVFTKKKKKERKYLQKNYYNLLNRRCSWKGGSELPLKLWKNFTMDFLFILNCFWVFHSPPPPPTTIQPHKEGTETHNAILAISLIRQ